MSGRPIDDVLVVGGGIIGLAIAREAARAGVRVRLLEKGTIGREASSAASGLLGPQLQPFLLGLWQKKPGLQLQEGRDQDEELGGRLEIELAGLLEVVDVSDHDFGQLHLEQVHLLPQDQRPDVAPVWPDADIPPDRQGESVAQDRGVAGECWRSRMPARYTT